jgi:transposase InsO family protein
MGVLEKGKRFPKAILSDLGSGFKQWKDLCCERRVEVHVAHPSGPQDKGKVERCVRSLERGVVGHLDVSWMVQGQTGASTESGLIIRAFTGRKNISI